MKKVLLLIIAAFFFLASSVGAQNKFPDIQKHWAKSSIQWALAKHMVVGYPDGTFKPDHFVTEAEFLAMLMRIYINTNKEVNEWKQAHQNIKAYDWTDPYYQIAASYNIPVEGDTNLTERVDAITRGQVAQMIAGAYGKNYYVDGAIAYLYDYGLSQGRKGKTIVGYEPNSYLTRAEAVQFLKTIETKGLNGKMLKRPNKPEPNPNVKKYKK